MKKTKRVVPIAHKRAISTMEKYKERVQNEKDLKNEDIEQFIIDVSPFLTKKGTLRKGLSNKKIEQFNALVSEVKEKGINTLKGIKQANQKKINDKRATSWVEGEFTDSREIADEMNEILKNKMIAKLVNKGYISIYHLRDLVEEDIEETGTDENTKKVSEYIIKQIESETPSEILEEVHSKDDMFNLMNDLRRSKAKIFMTKEIFTKWVDDNFRRVSSDMNLEKGNIDYDSEYQKFLEGEYNRFL